MKLLNKNQQDARKLTRNLHLPSDLKLCNRLQDLIEEYFRTYHNPEFYTAALNQTLTRLNHIAKFHLGKTVYECLQSRLHQEAKHLLLTTTLSAKQISYELGICDPSYFGKWFKRVEGVSPKTYRKQFTK